MKKKAISVLVYCDKGAMGKTTHAVMLAHYLKANFYTNDIGKHTLDIYRGFFQDKDREFKELEADEKIEIDDEKSNVFDFGGFLDNRVIGVAKFVDYCVVPICFQSAADFAPTITSIKNLEKYNKNIVILINNTEKEYVEYVFKDLSNKFKYPIFIINKSKYIRRLANDNKTIYELSKEKGLSKLLNSPLINQIKQFYSHLDK